MKSKSEIESEMRNFTGTEQYHRASVPDPKLVMTDGVKYLADSAECYWMIDAIASHQPAAKKHRGLARGQFWSFVRKGDHSGVLACGNGNHKAKPVISQEIEMTDFPLDQVRIWVMPGHEGNVMLLPSEY